MAHNEVEMPFGDKLIHLWAWAKNRSLGYKVQQRRYRRLERKGFWIGQRNQN